MTFDPNDEDTKAALKTAVEEAVSGLQAKNAELLGKLKKAQKDSLIDPADHAALQAELEQAQGQLAESTKAIKTITAEADKHKKAYETEAQFAHRLLVDNGLTDSLLKAGVKPELSKAVKAMMAGQVSMVAEGDNRIAKVGDKPLADFVAEWAKSDEGKHFVAAPANQGGGASGGANGGGNSKKWSDMNLDERTNLFKSNPEQAKALQAAA
jgi:hypothetical protein